MATAAATQTKTILSIFADTVKRLGAGTALRFKKDGAWHDVSWTDYAATVRKVALGLRELGFEKGDRASILASSRKEWVYADLGILSAGGATAPIYPSVLPGDVAYILNDSGAKVLFLENPAQLVKCNEVKGDLDGVKTFVVFDDADEARSKTDFGDRVISFDDLLKKGESGDTAALDKLQAEIKPDDLLTLVYTSGTTGKPKGVMLTHGNVASEIIALDEILKFSTSDSTLLFLPLAHIFARVLHFAQVNTGYQIAFAEAIEKVRDNAGETSPTFLASVPRVLEKFHAAVMGNVEAQGGLKKKLVTWALARKVDARRREREGGGSGGFLDGFAGRLVGKVRAGLLEKLGGKIEFFISGGAPLGREIAEFFDALGFIVLEGYGLTETTAATHINRKEKFKLGTVGPALPGVEVKIAGDGEILVRGPNIMKGYFNRPDATKEALEDDGWFHTGDIGEIDSEGFLRITDRKKDLIVTAAGKNIAPQNVENHLKTIQIVSQVMVYGDKRKYLVGLITLDQPATEDWAKEKGIDASDWSALCANPAVKEEITRRLEEKNKDLASYETLKYFEILSEDFTIENEFLTPTLKLKRKKLVEAYQEKLDGLYQ